MNPERLGVTTSANAVFQRTNFDNKLEKEFNPVFQHHGPPKPFQYEAFSYRTKFDKGQLHEFDPAYRNHAEVREAYQRGHSHLNDDPYQPYSYQVLN